MQQAGLPFPRMTAMGIPGKVVQGNIFMGAREDQRIGRREGMGGERAGDDLLVAGGIHGGEKTDL